MKPAPDACINERVIELSKDSDLIYKLTESIAPCLIGLEKIKLAILYHLVGGVVKTENGITSRGAIHVLLIGDPGTGKTQLLRYAETLSDVVSATGTGVNAGVLAAIDSLNQHAPSVPEETQVKAGPRYLHIDKLDKMNTESRTALETLMEQQIIQKANLVNTGLNTGVSILATSNPLLGRYNMYQTVAQNISLPGSLLSCFDLIFIIRDRPEHKHDRTIAEKILKIELEPNQIENLIDHTLLYAYIVRASQMTPTLSHEAKSGLRDFYLDIRRASDEGDAISITPRQLLSLVRLAEARAKLHQRETVSGSDAEAAIRMFSESLEQVGIDPVTHHYDIDVLYTGKPTVLNNKLLKAFEAFSELEQVSAMVREADLHDILFELYGMNQSSVSRLLRTLVKEELLTSPSPGYYRRKG